MLRWLYRSYRRIDSHKVIGRSGPEQESLGFRLVTRRLPRMQRRIMAIRRKILWRACNLTSFSPCLTGPVDYLLVSCQGTQVQIPRGVLMWNWDSPASDVSLHWWRRRDWSSLWPRLRWASSWTVTRPSCRQCDNPTWSHIAVLSRFHACCRSSFWLHNRRSQLLGGSPVECLQSHFILTMSHWSSGLPACFPSQGTQVQIPRGVLVWNRDSPASDVSLQYPQY